MKITSAVREVGHYLPFTLQAKLPYISGNPNDQDKIKVEAIITSPDGQKISVPAFCVSNKKGSRSSRWEARFTPVKPGKYEYYLESLSNSFNGVSDAGSFDVKITGKDGFLRANSNNPYYLIFDSGKPFFGIGHNVGWCYEDSANVFDRYFTKLEKNGCNLTRTWLCSWSFPIEYKEIGEYNQTSSEKLDKLIKLAAKRDIYMILCLDTYGSFMAEKGSWGENRWGTNPYNKKNGGPCENPEDFFTNPEAKKHYKDRIKYIISRWSYSPNIIAFELINEYNVPEEWAREMSEYIKSINPHGQFVTISFGYPFEKVFDASRIWKLKDIDMITLHEYGNGTRPGLVPQIVQKGRKYSQKYKKPFIITEFGIDFSKDDKTYDKKGEGTALHNSIWASSLSKSFGSTMNWWHDSYVRPKNLYFHYMAISKYLKGIDWDSPKIEYPRISPVKVEFAGRVKPSYRDVVIRPQDRWEKLDINEFVVSSTGDLDGAGMPNKYLHGMIKKEMKVDHIFNVEYPRKGKFILYIGTVSQGAKLHVYLDGEEVATKEFPVDAGEGPWERSLYLKKYKVYQCVYNVDFEIDVPEGEHTITLSNSGKDWIGLEKITLKDYVDNTHANARCLGLIVGEDILFWIQNKASNWRNTFTGDSPEAVKKAYFDVYDIENGIYNIEWWDTHKGKVLFKVRTRSTDGTLRVRVPKFLRDIACKIIKV